MVIAIVRPLLLVVERILENYFIATRLRHEYDSWRSMNALRAATTFDDNLL